MYMDIFYIGNSTTMHGESDWGTLVLKSTVNDHVGGHCRTEWWTCMVYGGLEQRHRPRGGIHHCDVQTCKGCRATPSGLPEREYTDQGRNRKCRGGWRIPGSSRARTGHVLRSNNWNQSRCRSDVASGEKER